MDAPPIWLFQSILLQEMKEPFTCIENNYWFYIIYLYWVGSLLDEGLRWAPADGCPGSSLTRTVMNDNEKETEAGKLRLKAETQLKTSAHQDTESGINLSVHDHLKLIHELQVHQVELQMQNEELRHAWAVGQVSVDKFTELYEFAPTGYLSLSREGKIAEINFSASQMLAKERARLKNSVFSIFVSDGTKPVFRLFFEKVFNGRNKETCELTLVLDGNLPVYVQLTGRQTEKGDQCLVSMVDITTRQRMENMNMARLGLMKFADNHNMDDLLEETLNQAELLTGSLIGFFHFIGADQKTIMLQNWSTRTKRDFCKAEGKGMHYDVALAGVWADCVLEGRPVIHNDYMSLPHRKGMPPGHATVIRELAVPVLRNGKIMAMLGIGNKPTEYTDLDVAIVSLLADLVWDIVERKRAEESLQNSLSLIEATLDSIHNAILVVDFNGKVLKTNRLFAALMQFPAEIITAGDDKVLLNHILDKLSDPEGFMARVSELYENPDVESLDLIYFKDGRIFERISKPMYFNGKPVARVWSFLDVTASRSAQGVLEESENRYHYMFDNSPQPMFIYDLETLAFLEVNQAEINHYGYSREEFLSMTLKDIRPAEHIPELMKDIEIARRDENEIREWQHIKKDGSLITVEITALSVNYHGRKARHVLVNDITARKNAEQQLKLKNEELQNLNAEKEKFFSIIAHDMRGPFNAFLGFTQLLVEDLDSFTLNELQEIAMSMRNSATSLYGLLENLLEWSRIRRGVTSFEPSLTPLIPVIEESLTQVRDQAAKKELELIFEITPGCEVFADSYMLGAIIRNLVVNAVKFSQRGGKIIIAAKQDHDRSVEISIRDSGIGMNQTMVDNLFHLDGDTTRKGTEGEPTTGLGLIICKEFVEKHRPVPRLPSVQSSQALRHK